MRVAAKWSQEQLATAAGMNQNAISRLESPEYGKATITTLKRLAAEFDVGLIVRFVPFSAVVDWVSGTPRVDCGLTSDALAIPDFAAEEEAGVFDQAPVRIFLLTHSQRFAVQDGGPSVQTVQTVSGMTAGAMRTTGQHSRPVPIGKKGPQVQTDTTFRHAGVQTGAR